jgi:hypothetical protein
MKTFLVRSVWLIFISCTVAACTTTQRPVTYPGNCYPPYDRAVDGSLCGRRAALLRPGGY